MKEYNFIVHKSDWIKSSGFKSWEIMESNGHGFARLFYMKDNDEFILADLFVDKKYRKTGMATQLIEKAYKYVKSDHNMNVNVYLDAEQWLINFYRKNNILISYVIDFKE